MNIFEATATNTLLDWLTGSEPPVTAEQAGDAAVTLANQANKALLSGVTAPATRDLWPVVVARVGPAQDTDPGLPLSAVFDNQPTEPQTATQEAELEWCVFHGGEHPDESAGYRVVDDQAEAEEDAQWLTEGGVAWRNAYRTPWTVLVGAGDRG